MFSIKKALGQFAVFLHVLWMVLQTAYELCDWTALIADMIHRIEQRELVS